jgi:hypothetical protein
VSDPVSTDLVEYFIVVVPDLDAVGDVAAAVAALVRSMAIRILDAVVLVRGHDDGLVVHELDDAPFLDTLRAARERACRLSDHDIALASLALPLGGVGLVVVVEDRWAAPLSAAARRAGGEIIAGERIPVRRVESALRDTRTEDDT